MYFCNICNIDYIRERKYHPVFDKPIPDKEIRGNKYCTLCCISVDDWERHLVSVLHNIKKHIHEYHKPLSEQNNKGNILCELCNIRVQDYYRHTFSALHRFNTDLKSFVYYHDVKDFVDHFNMMKNEKDIEDILKPNEENIFWVTAKEEIDDEQYNQLKGEIIGKSRKPGSKPNRRNRSLYWTVKRK